MPVGRSNPPAGPGNAAPNASRTNTQAAASGTAANSSSKLGPPVGVWARGGGNALKVSMANSAANSVAGPRGPPPARNGLAAANVANVTSQFGRMHVSTANPTAGGNVYNPSQGPTPSTMSTSWRQPAQANSEVSTSSFRQVVFNAVCRMSGRSRRDFRLGDVVALPFHTPNTNPHTRPDDPNLTATIQGPVYSKRRMAVVLWMYQRDMFCLPLYTFEHKGLSNKAQYLHKEYVSLRNKGSKNAVAQGPHKPIEVVCRKKPIDDETVVHIAGGFRVACNEDITFAGRLTQVSHTELCELWQKLSDDAQAEGWRE